MKVRTDQPLVSERSVITQKIAKFWDQISAGWQTVWGPHIHHGYYENAHPQAPLIAQEKLIEKLAELLTLSPHAQILDVGCGMGGSSIYLAKNYHANVIGITLSQKQVAIATQSSIEENLQTVSFKIEDALSLQQFDESSFDIVWSLESCEQFFDKNLFIKNAFRVLKPGGKLMLATWCSDSDEYQHSFAKDYTKLCKAFDLPYMPTMEHYAQLLTHNKFQTHSILEWSAYVKPSWDIGISLIHAYSFITILRMAGWRGFRFAKQLKLMKKAFDSEKIKYGVFIATKPLLNPCG